MHRNVVLSVAVFFRLAALTWRPEDLLPPSERYIFKFDSKEELKRWHLYADSEFNGISLVNFHVRLKNLFLFYLAVCNLSGDEICA